MIFNIYLLLFTITYFGTVNTLPYHRYRRQLKSPQHDRSSYEGRSIGGKNPSDSIVGTYYYGVGSDPNYGSFIRPENRPNSGGISAISYNPDSSLFQNLYNPSYPQQNYASNLNNAWQRPNTNNYYNQPYNRYAPGSLGWYAVGGNYWYNNGQFLIAHPCVLIINILILIICK